MKFLKKQEAEAQALVTNNICPDLLMSPKLAHLKTSLNKIIGTSVEELENQEPEVFFNPYAN